MTVPAVDQQAHDWFVAHRVGWLDPVEKAISLFGSTTTVVLVTMLLSGLLLWRARAPKQATFLAMTTTLSCVVLFSVKMLVKRLRPPSAQWLADGPGYSFPSGHATLSAALATALVVLVLRRAAQAWVWPVVGAGVLFSLLVGVSRLYLGVHWLTDVLAGWTLGVLVALAAGAVVRKFPSPETAQFENAQSEKAQS
ncbi:MAG: phosphatase PAP2 family protein [Segniliparus sp.]|uniref:phosphatase PAP2 family protein n=1 Tax=Segniliparus sp. TaxID=2804064 RepID=UPI003F355E69